MWNKLASLHLILMGVLLCLVSFKSENLQADILIQAMDTSNTEYQSALHLESSAQSFSDWQKSQVLKQAPVAELRRLYTAAMATYLQGSLSESQKLFEKVADLRNQYHWSESARYLIFTAVLRRAQSETKSYVKQSWLNVSLEIGWDLKPDDKIFPPPLIQEWQQQRDQLQWISIHTLLSDPYLSSILINGHYYDLKKIIPRIPKLRARVTLLSNQKQSVTSIVSTDQIFEKLKWKDWIVSQKCNEPKNWESTNRSKFRIIWPSNCQKNLDLEITQTPKALLSPVSEGPKLKTSSNWIWWGLGAIAVAYVVHSQNKQQESSSGKSSTYGF